MAIVFSRNVFATTIIDSSNYYSPPEFDRLIGTAEKYCVQVMTTGVSGASLTMDVTLQTSENGTLWNPRSSPIKTVAVSEGAVLFGYDLGTAPGSGGRSTRVQVVLLGTNPKAYVRVWLTGRDAH